MPPMTDDGPDDIFVLYFCGGGVLDDVDDSSPLVGLQLVSMVDICCRRLM